MDKEKDYVEIDFIPGDTIEEAVDKLLAYRQRGQLVYGKFNGITLYSDTVTVDYAYRAMFDMSKEEFDRQYRQMDDCDDYDD